VEKRFSSVVGVDFSFFFLMGWQRKFTSQFCGALVACSLVVVSCSRQLCRRCRRLDGARKVFQ